MKLLFRIGVLFAATSAVAVASPPVTTPYVAAFAPLFGVNDAPHAGTMQLAFRGAHVSGTYTGDSVAPDDLNDRVVAVTGTVDRSDGAVQLAVGNTLWFTGTLASDGSMSGTANYDGRLYEFLAKPGSLQRRQDR